MANKVEQQTANRKWTPPRGIRLFKIENRGKGWAVQWRLGGARKTKTFLTQGACEAFAKSLASDVKLIGAAAFRLDDSDAREWRSFKAQIGDATIDEVVRHWLRTGAKTAAPKLKVVAAEFIAAKRAEGLSSEALGHYELQAERLAEALPDVTANRITREDIAAWLGGLKTEGGQPFTPRTRTDYLKRARQMFEWLKLCGKIAANPCDGIRAPKMVASEVELYTVAQGVALFERNLRQPRELLGRLALEAFAGLRFASAQRIVAEDIKLGERGIVLPASEIKTGRRQYIDGLPANLWSWIEWSKPQDWNYTERQYLEAKSQARVRADLPEIRNALRHSFCSYHIAALKDASRTSVILCHTSPAMLWRHYRGNATEADGKAWFQIMPPPVEEVRSQ